MIGHDTVLASLGSNIRKAREIKTLTQEKLAEIADLDPTITNRSLLLELHILPQSSRRQNPSRHLKTR